MDFARKQLLKYGWSEGINLIIHNNAQTIFKSCFAGKGLGKNEGGIAEALKPTLKFDTTGVGHNASEQFTFNWWENVYNQAADNIKVRKIRPHYLLSNQIVLTRFSIYRLRNQTVVP